MMEINDDKLIRSFLAKEKKEVADNGFSRCVIENLPGKKYRLVEQVTNVVMLAWLILFFAFDGLQAIMSTVKEMIIGMIQHGSSGALDPKSLIIAAVVLIILGTRKIYSME